MATRLPSPSQRSTSSWAGTVPALGEARLLRQAWFPVGWEGRALSPAASPSSARVAPQSWPKVPPGWQAASPATRSQVLEVTGTGRSERTSSAPLPELPRSSTTSEMSDSEPAGREVALERTPSAANARSSRLAAPPVASTPSAVRPWPSAGPAPWAADCTRLAACGVSSSSATTSTPTLRLASSTPSCETPSRAAPAACGTSSTECAGSAAGSRWGLETPPEPGAWS